MRRRTGRMRAIVMGQQQQQQQKRHCSMGTVQGWARKDPPPSPRHVCFYLDRPERQREELHASVHLGDQLFPYFFPSFVFVVFIEMACRPSSVNTVGQYEWRNTGILWATFASAHFRKGASHRFAIWSPYVNTPFPWLCKS